MITVKIFGQTDMMDGNVKSGAGRGMHFMVNGWCLSAQAGWGSYCSEDPTRCNKALDISTIRTDCEIALWKTVDNATNMINLGSDTVMGWVKWDMVFDIIQWLKGKKDVPSEKQIRNKVLSLRKRYDKGE